MADPSSNGADPEDDIARDEYGVPEYLQSTIATESYDDWAEAISQAETVAAASLVKAKGLQPSRQPSGLGSAEVWRRIRAKVSRDISKKPVLSSFLFTSILSHSTFAEALAFILSNRISDQTLLPSQLFTLFTSLEQAQPQLMECAAADLEAVYDRDPSCQSYSQALLYFKGYHALQLYRFAHELWQQNRKAMAMSLQSRLSEVLAVDIHPAATIKQGILMDHGTGIVIGETAFVGNGVSMMQNVTLGGTGKEIEDRHPKVGDHVLIGCGATILGNITIGVGAQIASGSLVLKPVEAHTLVAGSPAKFVRAVRGNPAELLEQWLQPLEVDVVGGSAPEPTSERRTITGTSVLASSVERDSRLVDAKMELFRDLGPKRSEWEAESSRKVDSEEEIEAAGSNLGGRMGSGSLDDRREVHTEGAAGMVQEVPNPWPQALPSAFLRKSNAASVDAEQVDGLEALVEGVPVEATTCDRDALERWGDKLNIEPEFFI